MSTQGFPSASLTDEGLPRWIGELSSKDLAYTVHAVRELEPARALGIIGVRPARITAGVLPSTRPDRWTSLPRAALGPTDAFAVLLAARVGSWTFVFDDSGSTNDSGEEQLTTQLLAAEGTEAISTTSTINADTDLMYSLNGELTLHTTESFLDTSGYQEVPAELRAAFEAAKAFDRDQLEPGTPDTFNERMVCAHADLRFSLDELRQLPCLIGSLG